MRCQGDGRGGRKRRVRDTLWAQIAPFLGGEKQRRDAGWPERPPALFSEHHSLQTGQLPLQKAGAAMFVLGREAKCFVTSGSLKPYDVIFPKFAKANTGSAWHVGSEERRASSYQRLGFMMKSASLSLSFYFFLRRAFGRIEY